MRGVGEPRFHCTCNFLYYNHQVRINFLITLYTAKYFKLYAEKRVLETKVKYLSINARTNNANTVTTLQVFEFVLCKLRTSKGEIVQ
jgi:hypothetical protein